MSCGNSSAAEKWGTKRRKQAAKHRNIGMLGGVILLKVEKWVPNLKAYIRLEVGGRSLFLWGFSDTAAQDTEKNLRFHP